ncbi:MAG TPA: hypothetical protein PKD85_10645 [Saprospiraceae bacterium]|nr:hypothetical protein [Saprospiraceae bacterium]
MFQQLLILKKTNIDKLNDDLTRLFDFLCRKDLKLDKELVNFLNVMIENAKKHNDQQILKRGQAWLSTIMMAQDNINPFSLEDTKLYRSKMRISVYYKLLNEIAEYFTQKEDEINRILVKAKELTSQMILGGFQLNVLEEIDRKSLYSTKEIQYLWTKLKDNPQTRIFQSNILLLIGNQDALIIFDEGMRMLWEE